MDFFKLKSYTCHSICLKFDRSGRLVSLASVGAAGPATRPALSLFEFLANSLYPPVPCFRSLSVLNPANPLIPRKRRNILPQFQCNCVSSKAFSQIFWDAMHQTGGDFFHILNFFSLILPLERSTL
jgi:hypothetical protein